jgi:hypothetical protein
MRIWKETKRNLYLHELLDRKASIQVCFTCKKEANWRCLDCFAGPTYCTECCRTSHSRDPFHRIERWTGKFYERSWLWKVGSVIHLGHKGDRCPQAVKNFDADLDIDEEEWFDWEDIPSSVLRSGSVRFFAPKTRNRGPQPVQDRPRYCGDRTGPPRTGLLRSTQPKKTGSDRFFGVNFVIPIKIIFISAIITLKIKRVIWHSITCKYPSFDQISRDLMNI